MRTPRGFAKNYFTLSAILAFSVQGSLQSQVAAVSALINKKIPEDEEELQENDPPCELLDTVSLFSSKACHCNCYFKRLTRLILLLNIFIPRCPFYCTYFAFRRTGVHPPVF